MPQTTNTIVRIRNRQEYLGQECFNVYHFLATGAFPIPGVAALATSFQSIYVAGIRALQSTAVLHTDIIVEQLNNGTELEELGISENGLVVDPDISPSFLAASYKLNRSSTDVRNGRKSICGLTEADVNGNGYSAAGLTKWQAGNAVMVAPISDGGNTWSPIILSRQTFPDPNELRYSLISGSTLRFLVRTQNSRQEEL